MGELEKGDKAGENAEDGGERCQKCYCKDCYPVESSYLVRGEDKLIGRREGRCTVRTRFHSSSSSSPQQPFQRPPKTSVTAILTARVIGP